MRRSPFITFDSWKSAKVHDTGAFVKELDRRYRVTFGRELGGVIGASPCDTTHFIAWMENSGWGQPRKWTWPGRLGPMTAWHDGDDWEASQRARMCALASERPELIRKEAQALFDVLRGADVTDLKATLGKLNYLTLKWGDVWWRYLCLTLQTNPVTSVELGEISTNTQGGPSMHGQDWPAIAYKATLKDGTIREGNLIFLYEPRMAGWCAAFGLDWHLLPDAPSKEEILRAYKEFSRAR